MLMYHLCMFYACHSLCNVYKMLSGAEIVSASELSLIKHFKNGRCNAQANSPPRAHRGK